jgi:hypothetical protein
VVRACLAVTALVATAVATSATAAPKRPADPGLARFVQSCSAAALAPALRIGRDVPDVPELSRAQVVVARQVATVGSRLNAPARAQAIALMAALGGSGLEPAAAPRHLFSDGPPHGGALGVTAFYARLGRVAGWGQLPPTLAAHRVIRGADPFRYQAAWEPALGLLARLAASDRVDVAGAVASGAAAPRHCHTSAAARIGMPLPSGTGYAVPEQAAGRETLFRAGCGTPVLAATPGVVRVERDDEAAGPWKIGVVDRGRSVTSWYSHVQEPAVRDGQLVLVGHQLAEVGELGDVQGCALGLTIEEQRAGRSRVVAPVQWLAAAWPRPLPFPSLQAPSEPRTIPATTFRVGTFNVLGAHLTGPGNDRPSFRPGAQRMAGAVSMLESSGISIVALQEFENPAASVLAGDGDWDLHRGTPNVTFRDGNSSGNAIAWRRDQWKLVDTTEFTVPWQVTLHMPVVTLENLATGARVTVVGVHNPASTKKQGNQQGARNTARAIEIEQIRRLRGASTTPVILGGDMNERATAVCHFLGSGLFKLFNGGSCGRLGHGGVDWVFGSTDLTFSSPVVNRSPLGSISDHPLVSSQVTLPAHEATD